MMKVSIEEIDIDYRHSRIQFCSCKPPCPETLKVGTSWISSPGGDKHLMSSQTLRQLWEA
jgi:hypothetical protein